MTDDGGFQLWANLPTSHKMMVPRYRDIKKPQGAGGGDEKRCESQGHLWDCRRKAGVRSTDIVIDPEISGRDSAPFGVCPQDHTRSTR